MPELLPEPERDAPAVVHLIGEPLFVPTPEAPPEAPPVPLPQADLLKVEPPKVELPPVGSALVLAPVPPPPLPVAPPVIEPVSLTVPDPRLNRVLSADLSPLIYRETTPGDTPMLRNWQTLALCSLMTTTLVVQIPVPATAGEQAKESETALLKKRLEKLEESSKLAADAAKKINDLKVDVSLIRNELKALHELGVGSSGLDKASVEQIKSKLGDIEQAILKLAPTTSRVALSPPVPSPTGRMMLVNFYPETLLFFVNGKEYRVSPGANRLLDNVPAGVVNYYVFASGWGMQPTRTTVLSPNETFTLTAR